MIVVSHAKLFWTVARRIGIKPPNEVLYWKRCIQRIHDFVNNYQMGVLQSGANLVDIRQGSFKTILKRKILGPTIDLKVGEESYQRH